MKQEQKGHTIILKDTEASVENFISKIEANYNSFVSFNLILDLTHDKSITEKSISLFKELFAKHKKNKKSILIVSDSINHTKISEKTPTVPTLLEAHDLIEMDEIERDLGF